jgi:hypothetical protein
MQLGLIAMENNYANVPNVCEVRRRLEYRVGA